MVAAKYLTTGSRIQRRNLEFLFGAGGGEFDDGPLLGVLVRVLQNLAVSRPLSSTPLIECRRSRRARFR